MSAIINFECNGCGKWARFGTTEKSFNTISIDITKYIAFSSGFVPKSREVELHFCNECYVEIKKGNLHYQIDDSYSKIIRDNLNLKDEIYNTKQELRAYQEKVSSLLKPLNQSEGDSENNK